MKFYTYIQLIFALMVGSGVSFAQTQTLGINQTASGNPSNLCNNCYTITIAYSISNINATGTQVKCTVPNNIFDFCSYGGASISTVGSTTTLTFNEGVKNTGSYSVSYSVKFKSGLACTGLNGTVNSTIQTIEHPVPVAATALTLTATSTEAWSITKYIQYGGYIWYQGYTAGAPFNYYANTCTSTVDAYYHLRVSNGNGCINLSNASITDNLPSNATVVDVKNGAMATIPFTTGVGTVTFSIGNGANTLDVATGFYDYYIHVTFPTTNVNQVKCNTATLKGTNICTSALKTLASNTECIKLLGLLPSNACGAFASQYNFGSGYQYFIGCPAYLGIGIGFSNQCNPSTVNYNNIGYNTPIPGQIHVDSFAMNAIPAGKTVTITVNTNCGPYTQTFNGPLAATNINFYAAPFNVPIACTITNFSLTSNMGINGNNSLTFGNLYFTILATTWNTLSPVLVGSTVSMTGATYNTSNGNFSCATSFAISNKVPKIELIKSLCNYYNYYYCLNENDTLNFSLAVNNYGNANFSGGSIKDVLPTGLQYVPNSSTFGSYNTYTGCNATNQAGTGITVAHLENVTSTNLQWNLPTLTATCNTGSNWYVINFKAKITNLAAAGLLTNSALCYDGSNVAMGETNPWNNSVSVYVCEKKLSLQLIKEVSADSIKWDSCVSVTAGATVYYRLKVTNPGNVPFTQIKMMDILPNTSVLGSDVNLVNCNVRGSNIPIYLTNFLPLGNANTIGYSTNPQPLRASAVDLNLIPNNTIACATPVTWATPLLANIQNQKSVRIDFGTYILGAGQSETFVYSAQVPPGALAGSVGWNSFAASASQLSVQTLGAESPKVCVNVVDTGCGCIGNFVWFDANTNGLQDGGEVGINGCTITLFDASNNQIGLPHVSTFDVNNNPGYYSFCGLSAGTYHIVVTPPAGYMLTSQNNSNPVLNSDVNPNTNTSANFTFNCQTNNDIDVGLTLDDGCDCAKSNWGNISISDQPIIIVDPKNNQAKNKLIGNIGNVPINPQPIGQAIKLICKQQKEPIALKCKTTYNFAASYNCSKPSCGSVQIVVTYPNGSSVTSTNTASFTTNDGGNYSITIYGICGNKICDSCTFIFKVVCPICPCDPKLQVKPTTQSITHVTTTPAYTLLSQNFSITTPASMLYTQLRAEVVSFSLQSGFSNECVSCKNLPYTWASIYNAANINTNVAVADSITMGNAPPIIQFTPSLSNTHINPRETIWSSYSGFTAPSTLNMQFILPPKSIITCCRLYGTICVKFTFRDRDCKECEVIVCFNYTIPPTVDNPSPNDPVGQNPATVNAKNTGCVDCKTAIDNTTSNNNNNENIPVENNVEMILQPVTITVEELEEQLKELKLLKAKGIKRGNVELIPVLETKLFELKKEIERNAKQK